MLLPLALALAGTAGSVAAFDGVAPIPTGAAINATTTVIRTRSANLTAPVLSETRIPLAAEGVSALTFSFNNLFNTSTEPVEIEKGTLNLWSGTWDPSPLAAPLNGEFEPVKAGKVPCESAMQCYWPGSVPPCCLGRIMADNWLCSLSIACVCVCVCDMQMGSERL
jgi:hypothetical protein